MRIATLILLSLVATAQPPVSPSPDAHQLKGTLHICGSPQMRNLLHLYEAGFHQIAPNVRFVESLTSTASAVAEVSAGRADIGLLGREIWPSEVSAFASMRGHPPAVVEVATGSYDVPRATFALMIFVHRSNPLGALTTAQLARVFGTAAGPARKPTRTWGELGLGGTWSARPIHLYGFATQNDKARIFRQMVFSKGQRWSPALHVYANLAGPPPADAGERILRALADDPDGIAISNVHYANASVKTLAIAAGPGREPVLPSRSSVRSRSYPLTRAVYMVFDPQQPAPAHRLTRAFLHYVLSRAGAHDVEREGNYLPLPPAAPEQRRSLTSPLKE